MRKIPMRKCIVTGESLPQKELLRIVRTPEKEIRVDTVGKMNGKGAYIKKDPALIETLKKKNILSRLFEMEVPDEIYDEISRVLNEQ